VYRPPDNQATVRVLPADITFGVEAGETVFLAAQRNGVSWPTICRGLVDCGVCHMEVVEGAEHVSPMQQPERETLTATGRGNGDDPDERLACCAKLDGDIVVRRRSVRLAAPDPTQRSKERNS
jgi:2Fe-2S ferredoxin